MKTHLTYLLVTLLFLFVSGVLANGRDKAPREYYSLDAHRLYGKVKSVKISSFVPVDSFGFLTQKKAVRLYTDDVDNSYRSGHVADFVDGFIYVDLEDDIERVPLIGDRYLEFSDNGYLIEESYFRGDILRIDRFDYDNQHNLVAHRWFYPNGTPKYDYPNDYSGYPGFMSFQYNPYSTSTDTYLYDSKGNLIEQTILGIRTSFTYDDKGRRTGLLCSDENYKIIYEYDEAGNRTAEIRFRIYKYDEKMNRTVQITSTSKVAYSYDSIGRVTEKKFFSYQFYISDSPDFEYEFIYDREGKCVEVREFRWVSQISANPLEELNGHPPKSETTAARIMTYKYDSKGNQIEYKIFVPNSARLELLSQEIRTFDEHGNATKIVKTNSWDRKKFITHFTYTYDQAGNWTKKTKLRNGVPTLIIERIIEYY